jgi:Mn-dependent DtxR family transcriptional regulator
MLEKLLNLLGDTRTHSLADLAHALDTSTDMVEAMLQHLEQMGRVRQVTNCDSGCQECAHEATCAPSNPTRIWALVDR